MKKIKLQNYMLVGIVGLLLLIVSYIILYSVPYKAYGIDAIRMYSETFYHIIFVSEDVVFVFPSQVLFSCIITFALLAQIFFFVGYFIHQKGWTLMKKMALVSGICCFLFLIMMLSNVFYLYAENSSLRYPSISYKYYKMIIGSVIWVPFCAALYNDKSLLRNVRRIALSCIVVCLIYTLFALILFFGEYLEIRLVLGAYYMMIDNDVIMHFVNRNMSIISIALIVLLCTMFVLQIKNNKEKAIAENVEQ